MGWSEKYKKSIDCDNPKGFSQRAHCQGRKKKMTEEMKDHEVSMAQSQLKKSEKNIAKLRKILGKKEKNIPAWVQAKITDTEHNTDAAAGYMDEASKSGDEGLRDWFGKSKSSNGKKGWVQLGGPWAGKPCARQPGQTSTPKCGSSKMAAEMSPEEEETARRRKNRQDPNQPEKAGGAKPTNVKTEEVQLQEVKDKPGKGSGKKDACYNKVKSRYSVWPSAYASGALVKCRKVGAANWGNKSESYEFSNWRDDFQATEYEFVDIIKPEPLKGETLEEKKAQKCWPGYEKKGTKKMFGKTYNNCVKKESFEKEIPSGDIEKLAKKAVKRIDQNVSGHVDKKDKTMGRYGEFVPSADGKKKVVTTIQREQFSDWRSELGESVMPLAIDPKKHREQQRAAKIRTLSQKGATEGERAAAERKTKGPKMFGEDWQKVNKKDRTDGMSAAAVKAYRRENPGSKLKTAVTGDPKPGSKDAKRRKSFCARSKGQQDMHNIDCSKTPDKPVCKARRRWKC